ncbi:MAG: PP2C family protein-serine/threonine phosphatase [Chloroflexota bacterium]
MSDEKDVSHISDIELMQTNEKILNQIQMHNPQAIELERLRESETILKGRLLRQEEELDHLTEELIEIQDKLLALYKLTQTIRSHLDLDQMLALLLKEATQLVQAEGAFMALAAQKQKSNIIQTPSDFLDDRTLNAFVQQVYTTQSEVLLNIENVLELPFKNVRNLFLIPITVQEEIRAALGLFFCQSTISISPHLKLARAIADYAGAQLENGLLHQKTLEQTKLETELALASRIQLQLLPQQDPVVSALDVAGSSTPALQVGGDFYDFIHQDEDHFMFVVGDVSGKGMSAAMIMAMARTVIRSQAKAASAPTPEVVMGHSNEIMYDDFTELGMFATVFIGRYFPEQQTLIYANAGHSPVIYCPANGQAEMLEADGPAMGVLPMNLSEDQTLPFHKGDLLIVATDGFSEASNSDGEMFGYERLIQLIAESASHSAQEIADILFGAIEEFSAGQLQDDDQTLIVVKGV